MKVTRIYKFRIYPTPEQTEQMNRMFGALRYVHNWALVRRRCALAKGEEVGLTLDREAVADLRTKSENVWMQELPSASIKSTLLQLDREFSKELPSGRQIRLKRKLDAQKLPLLKDFKLQGSELSVPKVDGAVKVFLNRPLPAKPEFANILKDISGRFFVTFQMEDVRPEAPQTDKEVGMMLGFGAFAALTDGYVYSLPKIFARLQDRQNRLQRLLFVKKKGSKNRNKIWKQLTQLRMRIRDMQKDFLHKLSGKLVRENQVLRLEKQRTSRKNRTMGLMQKEFVRQLGYKTKEAGRVFVKLKKQVQDASHYGVGLAES